MNEPDDEPKLARRRDYRDEEKSSSPAVKIFKGMWLVLLFPFKLLVNLIHLLNEIRMLVLSVVTIVVVLIVALIVVVVFKPAFAWEPLKTFLNADINVEQNLGTDNTYQKINNGLIKNSEIKLTQGEVTQLFRNAGMINQQSIVRIENNSLQFVVNIDDPAKPLWLLVRASKTNDNALKITDVGFERLAMPGFVAGAANSSFSGVTDLLAKQNGKDAAVIIFNQLLDLKLLQSGYLLSKVEFVEGYAILKYSVIVE